MTQQELIESGTVSGSGDTEVTKVNENICPHGASVLGDGGDRQKTEVRSTACRWDREERLIHSYVHSFTHSYLFSKYLLSTYSEREQPRVLIVINP